jgi:hypothetical protein
VRLDYAVKAERRMYICAQKLSKRANQVQYCRTVCYVGRRCSRWLGMLTTDLDDREDVQVYVHSGITRVVLSHTLLFYSRSEGWAITSI